MSRPRHLRLVPEGSPPAPIDPASAFGFKPWPPKPPLKPPRPSSAVRKAMRMALTNSPAMLRVVSKADARFPGRGADAVDALARHGKRITDLAAELGHALQCEHRYRLWRNGRRYDE